MQHCWDRNCAVRRWDRWCFGHEVEVEEFDELELDFSAGLAGLENRCDGQESVEVLECARVLRGLDEGACEGDDCCRLDGWAIDRLKEVKEMLLSNRISIDHFWFLKAYRGIRTFIYSSLENKVLDGGCSNKLP